MAAMGSSGAVHREIGAYCFGPFQSVGGVQGREPGACAPCRRRFILLGSISEILLVVSFLDIVYDCHLQPLLQS